MNELFLGRAEEQQRFQEVLESLIDPASTPQKLPTIFLIHGSGGMGKTTLLQRLYAMSQEKRFQDRFNTLRLDWEEEREHYLGLQVERDLIQPTTVLEVIYQKFVKQEEWKNYFQGYSRTQSLWQTARAKIKQAEEEQERADQSVQPDLTPEELEVYKNSEKSLAKTLGAGIAQLAQEKPLLIFFDTYELVDLTECDEVLRDVMERSGGKVAWVISGRSNLADNVWRSEAAKEALSAALEDEDPDIVAVAIRSLGSLNALEVPQLVRLLNLNESKDRYVREAAARQLGYMAENKADLPKVLEAVEPLISAMRNDYMRDVRNAASEAGGTIYFAMESPEFQQKKIGKKLKRALILAKKLEPEEEELEETDSARLIPKLKTSDDIDERVRIIRKLGNLKAQEAVRPLVQLLSDTNEDPDIRATAAAALGEIGTPTANDDEAIEALIKALEYDEQKKENDSFVRLQAAGSLGKLTATAAIDALNKAIRQDKFSNVRNAEKNALKNHIRDSTASNEDRKKAFNYLKLIYPEEAQKLWQELGQEDNFDDRLFSELNPVQEDNFDDRPVSDPIDALKQEENPDVCAAIADALGQREDSQALQPLLDKLKELEDGDWIARLSVIKALGKLKTSREQLEQTQLVQKILVDRWRNDAIADVRDAVENALSNIYVNTDGYKPAEQALKRYSGDPFLVPRLKAEISSAKKN